MKTIELTKKTLRIEIYNVSETIKKLSGYSVRHIQYCNSLVNSFDSFDFQTFKISVDFCYNYLLDIYGFEDADEFKINQSPLPYLDDIYTEEYQAFVFSRDLNYLINNETTLFLDKFFNEPKGILNSNDTIRSNRIFIIHGRDKQVKTEVARTLEKLGLEPVILDEQSNKGDTLFEKLDNNLDVGYAIAIYSPDDEGSLINEKKFKPRARQNVIFEHGLLVGRIGRKNVFLLITGESDLEIPSDIHGLVYEKYDSSSSWKFKLVKELQESGYSVDANKVL